MARALAHLPIPDAVVGECVLVSCLDARSVAAFLCSSRGARATSREIVVRRHLAAIRMQRWYLRCRPLARAKRMGLVLDPLADYLTIFEPVVFDMFAMQRCDFLRRCGVTARCLRHEGFRRRFRAIMKRRFRARAPRDWIVPAWRL